MTPRPIRSKTFKRMMCQNNFHHHRAILSAVTSREQLLDDLQVFADTIGVGYPDVGDRLQQIIDKHK